MYTQTIIEKIMHDVTQIREQATYKLQDVSYMHNSKFIIYVGDEEYLEILKAVRIEDMPYIDIAYNKRNDITIWGIPIVRVMADSYYKIVVDL